MRREHTAICRKFTESFDPQPAASRIVLAVPGDRIGPTYGHSLFFETRFSLSSFRPAHRSCLRRICFALPIRLRFARPGRRWSVREVSDRRKLLLRYEVAVGWSVPRWASPSGSRGGQRTQRLLFRGGRRWGLEDNGRGSNRGSSISEGGGVVHWGYWRRTVGPQRNLCWYGRSRHSR